MPIHLITGGAGFLGNQLALALHRRGERIRILDILEAPCLDDEMEYIKADILDRPAVENALQGVDVVHHHAALVPVTKAGPRFWRVNVDGTQVMLDAARRAGVKFFIHLSSSAVFGLPRRCPITAETPLQAFEPYGHSKLEAENRVRHAALNGLPCAIVRPRTIIGPGRLGIFKILYEWVYEGRRIYVIGSGNHLTQFIHVQDLVNFILLLAAQQKPGSYNVGAQQFGTLRRDLSALIGHAGTKARVVGIPTTLAVGLLSLLDRMHLSPLATWHYRSYDKPFHFDLSVPMNEIGWRPEYSDEKAFIESYDWFLNYRKSPVDEEARSTHQKAVKQGVLWLLKHLS